MIRWLDPDHVYFPPVTKALKEPNGLLAAGGNLTVPTLLTAYRNGIFPWYEPPDPILWWSPDPRAVLFPEQLHISHSMQKLLRKAPFTLSCDQAFTDVMHGCAAPRNYTQHTWISNDMIDAYTALHQAGYAHSVEVWQGQQLVGGLYGVAIGCAFFGESMFSKTDNASKFGFIALVQVLQQAGFQLIDCQLASQHLHSLGATNISRADFQLSLHQAVQCQPVFSPWDRLNQ